MAFITDEQKANDQNANATPGVPGASGTGAQAPMTSAGAGAGPTGAKGAPTGAATNTAAAQPFTNLNAYLTANAPQVQNQANTIAGNLTSQYGQTQNDINTGTSDFNQQVAGGYAAPNAQVVQQAAADPTNFAQTPSNVTAFQGQLNDQYTGPANFEGTTGYSDLNNEVNTATQNAAQVNTLPGLQTYLQGTEKNPTQGENTLDSVLLNQSPNAIKTVQAAAAPFSQLPGYLSNNVTSADALAAAAPGQAAEAAQAANTAFLGPNGVAPQFQSALNSGVTAAQGKENAYNTTVNQNVAALNPINAALNSFEAQSGVSGVSNPLTSYLDQQVDTTNPTLANVSTNSQYAEDAALQKLLGTLYSPALDQGNIGQAGSFNVPDAQAADVKALSQQIADNSTQSLFSQKTQPQIQGAVRQFGPGTILGTKTNPYQGTEFAQNWPSYQASLLGNVGDTSPVDESNFIAHGQPPPLNENNLNFYNETNPSSNGYNALLAYLQGLNPSGISGTKGGNYSVNN